MKTHLADGMKDFFDPNIEGKKSAQSAVSTAKRDLLKKFEKELKDYEKNYINKPYFTFCGLSLCT